ncbi:cobalamin biosynthesis protein [Solirubrobacter phytolaccae]|uniref:Cobalamin biosynthesis protein n=1 Tax=Solirubrobacter phytolaccae TaxID=1404360 RepID=A0A9X3NIN1_9ACTN|nr:cobalamin biosynthesis protein [Solirubrobacter phytolaccae]MDA0182037.1 cobalamin biosynthesis protein [Solirubrobacter phytolaccae]
MTAAGEPRPRAADRRGAAPWLVAGVGCSLGCPPEELRALIETTLPDGTLRALATVDRRAEEPAMLEAAAHFGVPLRTFPAHELARVDVPTPSAVVARHVGTPSVAEAAALLSGTRLLVPKTRSEHATCAVAECPE